MNVQQALSVIGATRVIWIDDCFNERSDELAALLLTRIEATRTCAIPELSELLEQYEFDEQGTLQRTTQLLEDLGQARRDEIRDLFIAQEPAVRSTSTEDLKDSHVELACRLLNVSPADRWSFVDAAARLKEVCGLGDANVSYIIDLNNIAGSPTEGIEILRILKELGSQGTAFILTHEADVLSESSVEKQLRDQLIRESKSGRADVPICVIAKQRLSDHSTDENLMTEGLRIAIKRAGLKRGVHEVLSRAGESIVSAFETAQSMLLEIPPEDLDQFVVKQGHAEGLSELHVVERAISASLASSLRHLFANDSNVKQSAEMLRSMSQIELRAAAAAHEYLQRFRKLEVWEDESLINLAHAPVACGDVFEFDSYECKKTNRRFLLLAQPCDIALRPDGRRASDVAFFAPLKALEDQGADDKLKEPKLPFLLDGRQWACLLRNVATARVSILDLCAVRDDGRVRYDIEQGLPRHLLSGLRTKATQLLTVMSSAIEAYRTGKPSSEALINRQLQLMLCGDDPYKHIYCGTYKAAEAKTASREALPERLIWSLRRCGRIRMPYASAILNDYLTVLSRSAFDRDFTLVHPSMTEEHR